MKIFKIDNASAKESTLALFTGGKVHIQTLDAVDEPGQLHTIMVNFAPGAKTKMHTHTHEQLLYVTQGIGIVATRNQEHTVTPGTSIHIPANEPHWHGATKDSAFSHLSVTLPGKTDW